MKLPVIPALLAALLLAPNAAGAIALHDAPTITPTTQEQTISKRTRVKGHYRRTKSGRKTHVRSHTRRT